MSTSARYQYVCTSRPSRATDRVGKDPQDSSMHRKGDESSKATASNNNNPHPTE